MTIYLIYLSAFLLFFIIFAAKFEITDIKIQWEK
ncbi:hypothetical protein SAMN05216354_2342 [Xylanibacter ruminicola]|jgi:hypothetical protein|uniref:Uncharacterized protein n=1 Tax=Xylanibacter ruminicola TaxID=839 RepID=A0A1H5WHE5_XYLRU|nr:hypothetical protein SAMN05216354_2342 [Xylanibacter ruminicola]